MAVLSWTYGLLFYFHWIAHSCPHKKPPSIISDYNHPLLSLKMFFTCLSLWGVVLIDTSYSLSIYSQTFVRTLCHYQKTGDYMYSELT
jgi:hypothetical protein